jgi:Flp pilus assembly protein TadD
MEPLPLSPGAQARLERVGTEFMLGFLRTGAERDPRNLVALSELGHLLTRLGRHDEGLDVDRKLVRLDPDNPVVHYNMACSLSLTGEADAAVGSLERAVELGYDDAEHLVADEDLTGVRDEPRFQEIVRRLLAET